MTKKTLIFLVAPFIFGVVLTALAQSQTPVAAPEVSPASSVIDNQGIRRYLLGPGDILDVRIWGQPDLNSTAEIDEDGNISSLPFIEDPIPAKCRTEKDIQKSVTEAYAKYLVKPRVSVRTVERKSRPPATIWGAVHAPTRVAMLRRIQLHEMVTAAGGFTDKAGGTIHIIHTMPELCPEPGEVVAQKSAPGSDIGQLETYKITSLRSGAGEGDPFIRAGDLVEVVEGDTVFVTGFVVQPQAFIMKDQTTLTMVIAQAGGVQRLAKTSEVHILRRKDGKMGGEDIKVNYEAIRKGQQKDVVLEPYDIVDVGELSMLSGKKLGDLLTGLPLSIVGKIPVR